MTAPIARNPRKPRIRLRPLLLRALTFFLLGAAANVAVAFALALLVDVSTGTTESAEAWAGQDAWTVTRWSRPGATYVLSVRESARSWSPGQATGPPNAPNGGDNVNAWASASTDGQPEWLELEYDRAVVPATVRVYETCATGALTKVGAFTADGEEVEAWAGVDPAGKGLSVGVAEVQLRVGFPTRRIKLYFDSPAVPGWNEVDAVELVDKDGGGAWARWAQASSTFAARNGSAGAAAGGLAALAPSWAGLDLPGVARDAGLGVRQKAVEARGWPMLSLWANVGSTATPAGGSGGLPIPAAMGSPGPMTSGGFLITTMTVPAAPSTPLAPASGRAALPIRPIWTGFLVNACFYGVVLFLLHWALVVPRRFVRELSRLRRGCCVACGYDLGFDFVPGCPECGWRRGHVSHARRETGIDATGARPLLSPLPPGEG